VLTATDRRAALRQWPGRARRPLPPCLRRHDRATGCERPDTPTPAGAGQPRVAPSARLRHAPC